MAVQTTHVGNLFLVRWDIPTPTDCEAIRAAFKQRQARVRTFHIGVLPDEMADLDATALRRLIEVTQEMLPVCAHVVMVVEARGARGLLLRRSISTVVLASSRNFRLSFVDSLDRALVWAPAQLPEITELQPAFARAGCELPPTLMVA